MERKDGLEKSNMLTLTETRAYYFYLCLFVLIGNSAAYHGTWEIISRACRLSYVVLLLLLRGGWFIIVMK